MIVYPILFQHIKKYCIKCVYYLVCILLGYLFFYRWHHHVYNVVGTPGVVPESAIKVKKSVDSLTSGTAFGLNKVMPVITTLIELNRKK